MKKMFLKVLSFVMVLAMLTGVAATLVYAVDADGHDHCPGFGQTHTEANKENATLVETVEAVCDVYGYTIYQCNECDDYFMADFVAPTNTAHELVAVEEVPAKCGETGMKAYEKCEKCNSYFADGERYTSTDALVIPALTHNYELVSSTGNCEQDGTATYTCSHCGDTYTLPVVGTGDGHTWVLVTVDRLPSVDADGKIVNGAATYKCACGATAQFPVICAHDEKVLEAVAPNCTETGLTAGKQCKICNYITVPQVVVPAVGHGGEGEVSFEVLEAVAPTCTTTGLTEGKKCLVCNTITVAQDVVPVAVCNGEELVEFGAVAGDCDTKAVAAGKKCPVCDHVWAAPVEGNFVHDSELVVVDPTCTKAGFEAMYCKECGEIDGEPTVLPKLGHETYDDAVKAGHEITETKASCTVDGKYTWSCVRCGEEQEKAISKTGHDLVTVNVDAICVRYGYSFTYCKNDNCTDDNGAAIVAVSEVVVDGVTYKVFASETDASAVKLVGGVTVNVAAGYDANNHGEYLVKDNVWNAPDCTNDGSHSEYCSKCNYTAQSVRDSALGHSYDRTEPTWSNKVVTDPTCTVKGYTTYTCADCTATVVRDYVDALGHLADVDVPAVDPTCVATGKTAGKDCSRCGYHTVPQTSVPATGHNFAFVETVLPKCDGTKGYDLYVCENAGCEDKRNFVDYDWNTVANNAYASVEEANKIHTLAPNGEKLRDMDCENGIDGLYKYECVECGKFIQILQVVEHTWGATVDEVPADCTNDGTTAGKECTICGAKEGFTVIPALGHSREDIPAVAPGCESVGSTAGVKCSVCGEILTAPEEIPATGHAWAETPTYDAFNHWFVCENEGCEMINAEEAHSFTSEVIVAPTCTEKGVEKFTCDCGYTKDEEIAENGHSFAPTGKIGVRGCETDQYVEWACTACKIVELREYLPAYGHNVETLDRVEPDCDSTGLTLGYICKNGCDSTDPTVNLPQEEIPATGKHYNAAGEELIDSCTNKNVTDRVCVTCDDENNNVIGITCDGAKTAERVVAPTCVDEGYTIVFCADCFAIKAIVAPTAPNPNNHAAMGEWTETTAPTCTKAGVETRACASCGYDETRPVDALGHTEAYAFDETDTYHWVVCTVCDEPLTQPAAHRWGTPEITVEAKPGVAGEKKFTCIDCKDTKVEAYDLEGIRVSFKYTSGIVAGADVVNGGLVAVQVYIEGTNEDLDNLKINFNYDNARLTWVATEFGGDLTFDTSISTVKNGLATLFFTGSYASGDADDMTEVDGSKLVATVLFRVDEYEDVLEADLPTNTTATVINGFYAEYVVITEVTEENLDGSVLLTAGVPAEALEIEVVKLGAVSTDAVVDGQDMIAMKKLIAEDKYEASADINKDGSVDAVDYMLLAQYLGNVYTYAQFAGIGA